DPVAVLLVDERCRVLAAAPRAGRGEEEHGCTREHAGDLAVVGAKLSNQVAVELVHVYIGHGGNSRARRAFRGSTAAGPASFPVSPTPKARGNGYVAGAGSGARGGSVLANVTIRS